MVSTTIQAIADINSGIARSDPTGKLAGITAGTLFDNHPEVISGYRPQDRPCNLAYLPQITRGVGICSLNSFDQQQAMTGGIALLHSLLTVALTLDAAVPRQGVIADLRCSSGALLAQ